MTLCAPLLVGASSTAVAAEGETPVTASKKGKKAKKGKKGKKAKKGKKGKGHARGLCAQLSCTDAQAETIGTRLKTLREQHREARKNQASLQTALSRELAKEKPSKKELARVQKDLARMQAKMADATLDALLDIHAVLDAEQRKTLASLVERNGLRRLMRGGGHKGRGPHGRQGRGSGPPPAAK